MMKNIFYGICLILLLFGLCSCIHAGDSSSLDEYLPNQYYSELNDVEVVYADSDGHFNIPFSDGSKGYCLEYMEKEAVKGDIFIAKNTSFATNNITGENVGNLLKVYFIDYNGFTDDPVVVQHMIWHFTDNFNSWRVNESLVKDIKKTAEYKTIPDQGVVRFNSTHNMGFNFKVGLSPYSHHQDYWLYDYYFLLINECCNEYVNITNITNTVNITNITNTVNITNVTNTVNITNITNTVNITNITNTTNITNININNTINSKNITNINVSNTANNENITNIINTTNITNINNTINNESVTNIINNISNKNITDINYNINNTTIINNNYSNHIKNDTYNIEINNISNNSNKIIELDNKTINNYNQNITKYVIYYIILNHNFIQNGFNAYDANNHQQQFVLKNYPTSHEVTIVGIMILIIFIMMFISIIREK